MKWYSFIFEIRYEMEKMPYTMENHFPVAKSSFLGDFPHQLGVYYAYRGGLRLLFVAPKVFSLK